MFSDEDEYILQTYFDRFINRSDVWFKQKRDGNYICLEPGDLYYRPVTLELIDAHLEGWLTGGWCAMDSQGLSKWCCWDSDKVDGQLEKIKPAVQSIGLHPLSESRRTEKDGHLWLSFSPAVPAADLIRFDQFVRTLAGVPQSWDAFSGTRWAGESDETGRQKRANLGD